MSKRIIVVLIILLLGFLLGWIFPIDGPIDDIYDEHIHKSAVKNGPPIVKEQPILEIDEEDLIEWYKLTPIGNEE